MDHLPSDTSSFQNSPVYQEWLDTVLYLYSKSIEVKPKRTPKIYPLRYLR